MTADVGLLSRWIGGDCKAAFRDGRIWRFILSCGELSVGCPWRIIEQGQIALTDEHHKPELGQSDRIEEATLADEISRHRSWRLEGKLAWIENHDISTLKQSDRIERAALAEEILRYRKIRAVEVADRTGDLRIFFENFDGNLILEVWNNSSDHDAWRGTVTSKGWNWLFVAKSSGEVVLGGGPTRTSS